MVLGIGHPMSSGIEQNVDYVVAEDMLPDNSPFALSHTTTTPVNRHKEGLESHFDSHKESLACAYEAFQCDQTVLQEYKQYLVQLETTTQRNQYQHQHHSNAFHPAPAANPEENTIESTVQKKENTNPLINLLFDKYRMRLTDTIHSDHHQSSQDTLPHASTSRRPEHFLFTACNLSYECTTPSLARLQYPEQLVRFTSLSYYLPDPMAYYPEELEERQQTPEQESIYLHPSRLLDWIQYFQLHRLHTQETMYFDYRSGIPQPVAINSFDRTKIVLCSEIDTQLRLFNLSSEQLHGEQVGHCYTPHTFIPNHFIYHPRYAYIHLYHILQFVKKFHPRFDSVLVHLILMDKTPLKFFVKENIRVILPRIYRKYVELFGYYRDHYFGHNPDIVIQHARFLSYDDFVTKYFLFLPMTLEHRLYLKLTLFSHLFLNTFPFGSGITSNEAVALCVPQVLLPQAQNVLSFTQAQIRWLGADVEEMMTVKIPETIMGTARYEVERDSEEGNITRRFLQAPILPEDESILLGRYYALHAISLFDYEHQSTAPVEGEEEQNMPSTQRSYFFGGSSSVLHDNNRANGTHFAERLAQRKIEKLQRLMCSRKGRLFNQTVLQDVVHEWAKFLIRVVS